MPRLGSGLESLIPQKKKKIEDGLIKKEAVFYIEIERIKPNPYQPRKEFDQSGLKALSESIKQHGIIQPLVVSRIEKKDGNSGKTEYQLIAGERRLMAAKMAGFKQVPVVIREPDNKEKLIISLVENVQREDLNPIEKAEAYRKLKQEFNLLHRDISRLVGKSEEVISNTLRLLQLPEKIKEAVRKGIISEGHARALLTVKNKELLQEIYNKIVKENLSVREAETLCYRESKTDASQKRQSFFGIFSEEIRKDLEKIPGLAKFKFKRLEKKPALILYFEDEAKLKEFIKNLKN